MGDPGPNTTDAYELEDNGIVDSQEPLTAKETDYEKYGEKMSEKDTRKDIRSFFLSIFNLMNAILGSGILGLAEAMMNLGVALFYVLLLMTACLAGYTINLLLQSCAIAGERSYEALAFKSFGRWGQITTCVMIIIHCIGAMSSYVFIIKAELPEVVRVFANLEGVSDEDLPLYCKGEFLMILVVVLVIVPLASMKDIRFLGYSSAFGMACMLLFTGTVIVKKFSIPCPLPSLSNVTDLQYGSLNDSLHGGSSDIANYSTTTSHAIDTEHHTEEQICTAEVAKMTSKSAYAVPTMFFSFMCHASMLPIYHELRRPNVRKMQKVANISILGVLTLYILSATFGYFTFYNRVESELLLTYRLYNPSDPAIVVSRIMVLICVTLSVPLLHYPCRKTIITTFFHNPKLFSWIRHIAVMIVCLTATVILVAFVPNIRDIFGLAGATSSASLLMLFPCAFYIKLSSGHSGVRYKRIFTGILFIFGVLFMIMSVALIINDWFTH